MVIPSKYSLDCSYCGFQFLYRQRDHLFNAVPTYLGVAYPAHAVSVCAGNGLFRPLFSMVFSLFARALSRRPDIGPGNPFLGGLSILSIPIPFTLYYYGERIRHASKNVRHDM